MLRLCIGEGVQGPGCVTLYLNGKRAVATLFEPSLISAAGPTLTKEHATMRLPGPNLSGASAHASNSTCQGAALASKSSVPT